MNKYTTPIKIVSENIPIGDIIICNDDGTERVMIERKSLNDLAASICDGRYKEQSFRLNQCSLHNHNIFYMIEGQLKSYKSYSRIDKRALLSSMVSIAYFKGFSVHRTNDMQESAEWIIQFADKLGREVGEKPFYSKINMVENKVLCEKVVCEKVVCEKVVCEKVLCEVGDNEVENKELAHTETANDDAYSLNMKRVKKNNITPENIGEIMLSQIPNVSAPTAISIMKQFKTIGSLMTSLQNDEHCLDNIKNESGKEGKERKINKTAISSIRKFLLYDKNSLNKNENILCDDNTK
jgi:ERCC4-type nuclease